MNDNLVLIASFVFAAFITIFFLCVLPLTVLVVIFFCIGINAIVLLIGGGTYGICKYLKKNSLRRIKI